MVAAVLSALLPSRMSASTPFRRCRPADRNWPSPAAWQQLNRAVGGNLLAVSFPLNALRNDSTGTTAERLAMDLTNPYYIRDQPGLTQSLGWVDAWHCGPSIYAIAAKNAEHIAAAVNFARDNDLRLVVKGGGHSYQGTSNAPDSLLIWTRDMHDIQMHTAFVATGCEHTSLPQPAVTVGAGVIGSQVYDVVTTKGGKYVQGGGCLTVGLTGLVLRGGFGSYSKNYGLAAGSLLEAEVITADGAICIANRCMNADLFWALKGGGGGTFGVVSKMTLRLHDLPEYFGVANFTVKAKSDDDYHELLSKLLNFYQQHLFNEHWGEQVRLRPDNVLEVRMNFQGLNRAQAQQLWQPFLDWIGLSSTAYSLTDRVVIGAIPAQRWWDVQWWKEHWPEIAFPNPDDSTLIGLLNYGLVHLLPQPVFKYDERPGADANNAAWAGDAEQSGQVLWAYQSLWLPASLLDGSEQDKLVDALFASSRFHQLELHFNKGLAGAPLDTINAAAEASINPAVLTAFALVIAAEGQGPAYPGIGGHEPSITAAHAARARVDQCLRPLHALVPKPGSYANESDYFEQNWQQSYWGSNYARLAEIKRRYDPDGLFFVHNGVGSQEWSADGFTKV
jgi:FAD/FMN-containing dehydrogenase